MKRWTLLLLMLLIPLTMAPRTSLNPGGGDLALTGILSRTEVRPGSAVTFVVQARNTTDSTLDRAQVNVHVGWDGKSDEISLSASRACIVEPAEMGYVVSCRYTQLDPDEQVTMRVTARPLDVGVLTFHATSGPELAPAPGNRTFEVLVRGRG
jgi:hypothetical protein